MKNIALFSIILTSSIMGNHLQAQDKLSGYMRVAHVVVDSTQLEAYKAALKEGILAAVQKEPGVISLSAVYDKSHPTHVTVFEIYASEEAYKSHIQTAHFLKYKATVQHMVKSLELIDVAPIASAAKPS